MAWGWETMSRDIYVSEWSPISRNGKYFSTIDIFSNNICCAKLELPCVSIGWGGGAGGSLWHCKIISESAFSHTAGGNR